MNLTEDDLDNLVKLAGGAAVLNMLTPAEAAELDIHMQEAALECARDGSHGVAVYLTTHEQAKFYQYKWAKVLEILNRRGEL